MNTGYMSNAAFREWLLELSFAEIHRKSVRDIPFSVLLLGKGRERQKIIEEIEDGDRNGKKGVKKGKRNRNIHLE